MIRIKVPDQPGTLGLIATAMGAIDADIAAVEIVEKGPDYAIDDFLVTLPPSALPDTLVSTCDMLDGVTVLWVSRQPDNWGIESDIAALNRMAEDPDHAAEILTEATPVVFRCQWAALFDARRRVLTSTALAPEFTVEAIDRLGPIDRTGSRELAEGWMPGWGDTVVACAPLSAGRSLVLGRQGGPAFLASELNRLQHMAALAN